LPFAVLFAASFYLVKQDLLRAVGVWQAPAGTLMMGETSAVLGVSKYQKLRDQFR
jgi:hypothetical protein